MTAAIVTIGLLLTALFSICCALACFFNEQAWRWFGLV